MPKNPAMKPASLPTPRVSFSLIFIMSPISIITLFQLVLLQVSAQPSTGMHHFKHAEALNLTKKRALQGTRLPRILTLYKTSLQEMRRAHPQHLCILSGLVLEAHLLQCACRLPSASGVLPLLPDVSCGAGRGAEPH